MIPPAAALALGATGCFSTSLAESPRLLPPGDTSVTMAHRVPKYLWFPHSDLAFAAHHGVLPRFEVGAFGALGLAHANLGVTSRVGLSDTTFLGVQSSYLHLFGSASLCPDLCYAIDDAWVQTLRLTFAAPSKTGRGTAYVGLAGSAVLWIPDPEATEVSDPERRSPELDALLFGLFGGIEFVLTRHTAVQFELTANPFSALTDTRAPKFNAQRFEDRDLWYRIGYQADVAFHRRF